MADVAKAKPAAAYVDNSGLAETFGDMVTSVGFDGSNFRIELAVTRMGHNTGGRDSTLHPVSRLVVPLGVANDLVQKLGGALASLEKQGILKKGAPPGSGAPPTN